ncbi:MAG: hypothetical protein PF636_10855 [Actinomycetota bacterium]|jgi:hypothetical protein|nr:hypothetical protein [Actinomycetota bacterium]
MAAEKKASKGSGKGYMKGDKDQIAERAATDAGELAAVFEALSGEDRRVRVLAARVVQVLAINEPEVLRPHADELTDALGRPEPQTRWEVLGAFEQLVAVDARLVAKAITAISTELHDAESGVVRLAAFRVLAAYGATTENRSNRVWPLIDEAIRVYHGDPEFPAMLVAVVKFVQGEASKDVKTAAALRMEFDSEHTKGLVGRRAKQIVSFGNLPPKSVEGEE